MEYSDWDNPSESPVAAQGGYDDYTEPEPMLEEDPIEQTPSLVEAQQVDIQSSNEEYKQIAQQLIRGRTIGEQQQIAVSNEHYEMALRYHAEHDFEKAKVDARRALKSWPGNRAARTLLTDLNQLTTSGRPEYGVRAMAEDELNVFRVKIEQAQIEISKHIRDGERYYNARMFDEAINEFENAEFKIKAIPYDVKPMLELLPRVRDYVVRTRNQKILEGRRVEMVKRQLAL